MILSWMQTLFCQFSILGLDRQGRIQGEEGCQSTLKPFALHLRHIFHSQFQRATVDQNLYHQFQIPHRFGRLREVTKMQEILLHTT